MRPRAHAAQSCAASLADVAAAPPPYRRLLGRNQLTGIVPSELGLLAKLTALCDAARPRVSAAPDRS